MSQGRFASTMQRVRSWVSAQSVSAEDDSALLQRFVQHKDEQAFDTLLRRYGPMVLGVCRRILGQAADADDAFQATFLVLARKAGTVRRGGALAGWLFQVASHIALKARGSAARRRQIERQVQPMRQSSAAGPAEHLDVRGILDEELRGLPEKQRLPLVLCYLQGKSQRDAARELGLPEGSMAWHLDRAREQMRKRLAQRGVALGASGVGVLLGQQAAPAAASAALLAATRKGALAFALGRATTGLVSARVVEMATATLPTLATRQLARIAALILLGSIVLGASGSYVAYRAYGDGLSVAGADAAAAPMDAAPRPAEDRRVAALRKMLAKPITLENGIDPGTPLQDALEFLADRHQFKYRIDEAAFVAAGMEKVGAQPVQMPKLKDVRLDKVLHLLLENIRTETDPAGFRLLPGVVEILPKRHEPIAQERPSPALTAKLAQPITLEKGIDAGTPLQDVLELLAEKHQLNCLILTRRFEEVGIAKAEEVPVRLPPVRQVPLGRVLGMLVEQLQGDDSTGGWAPCENHVEIFAIIKPQQQPDPPAPKGK